VHQKKKNLVRDIIKLRRFPKALTTKRDSKEISSRGRANSPGYGKNVKDATMGEHAAKS
jgi:hypothetical protein